MSLFEDAMSIAVQLPTADRERLAQALGVKTASPARHGLPMHQFAARPDPVAWRKAETGHAVLATDTPGSASEIPAGPSAIQGIWGHRAPAQEVLASIGGRAASLLPKGAPAIVHTDACLQLGLGSPQAIDFFAAPPVEIRLATASYLALLEACESQEQQRRVRRFVQPYAVLSLGPMASSRSVELMFSSAREDGLTPLDALIASTALAHEIPLIALDPRPFVRIEGLTVCTPH